VRGAYYPGESVLEAYERGFEDISVFPGRVQLLIGPPH
jgi:hypothetical protein